MPIAFISHSSQDRTLIEQEILPRLKEHKIDVWYSPEAIVAAADWERAIKSGLQQSDVVVVMMSPHASGSQWVKAELHWAFTERRNRVVPVMLESCRPEDCHILLGNLQHINFAVGGAADSTQKIASAITRACSVGVAAEGEAVAMTESEQRAAERSSPLLRMAITYLGQADYSQALKQATSALEISQHAGAYYVRGLCHFGAKNWPQAIDDFSTTLYRGPLPALRPLVYIKRAKARAQINDELRGIIDCDRAISLDPSNVEGFLVRGTLRRRILQTAKASEDFSELIRLDPKSVEGHMQLAQVYRELGDVARAKDEFETVRKLDPTARIPDLNDAPLEAALNTLRVLGRFPNLDALPAEAQAQLMSDLMRIGFPQAIKDMDYIIQHLPAERAEHRLAVILLKALKAAWPG